jgi:hypothetical protein
MDLAIRYKGIIQVNVSVSQQYQFHKLSRSVVTNK